MKKNHILSIALLIFGLNAWSQKQFNKEVNNTSQIGFIKNNGQIIDQYGNHNPLVYFILNRKGMNVQLRSNGFSYDTYQKSVIESNDWDKEDQNELSITRPISFHRIDIDFVYANSQPEIIWEELEKGYINYYTHGAGENGITRVQSFRKIIYKDIYPNIDVEFLCVADGDQQGFKYNFIVRPGGDYTKIKIRYNGSILTNLVNNQIIIQTIHGNITENIPKSFLTGSEKLLSVDYDDLGNATFGFKLNEVYDSKSTLVIDPTPNLLWATYYGGSGFEGAFSHATVRTDNIGNVYFSSDVQNSGNLATVGAYQTVIGGTTDCFLVKFDSLGNRLWATYYGGNQIEYQYGDGLCIDQSNNAYICGLTNSGSNIATAGAYDITLDGTANAFIAKFNSSGIRQWGTYFGTTSEIGSSIVTDGTNYLYVSGRTSASFGIATPGTFQTAYTGGSADLFVEKFDLNGTTRVWGTYYGGGGTEQRSHLAYDPGGFIYLAGETPSTTSMSSVGSHQPAFGGGGYDGFLAKLDASNGTRLWGTYYGGNLDEGITGVQVNSTGNVYIVGGTESANNISTAGSHQSVIAGNDDGFLACFNSAGVRQWGTYFGGSADDNILALWLDPGGSAYISGYSGSPSGIATPGAYQTIGVAGDAFVSKFSAGGNQVWGTYYTEGMNAVSITTKGSNVYTLCITGYNPFATPGSFQTSNAGPNDLFLIKFDGGCSSAIQPSTLLGSDTICSGSSNTYSVTNDPSVTSYTWTLPGGWTGTSTTNSINTVASSTSGNISVTANNSCGNSAPQILAITVNSTPSMPGIISGSTTICSGSSNTYSVTNDPSATSYTWTLPGGWTGTSTTNSITTTASSIGGNISVIANNTCGSSTPQTLSITVDTIPPMPGPISGPNPICTGSNNNYSISPVPGATSYSWTLPPTWSGTYIATLINTDVSIPGTYNLTITANNNCGSSPPQSLLVHVISVPIMPGTISGPTSICEGSANTYSISPIGGVTSYTWGLPFGWSGSSTTNSINTTASSASGSISVTADNVCGSSTPQTLAITVNSLPGVTFTYPGTDTICIDDGIQTLSGGMPAGGTYSGTGVTGINFDPNIAGLGDHIITYSFTDGNNCTNSDIITLTVIGCAGIEDNNPSSIVVYPNPFTSTITVSGMEENSNLSIYNSLGQKIDNWIATGTSILINCEHLTSDIYFITIQTEDKVIIRKILKSK